MTAPELVCFVVGGAFGAIVMHLAHVARRLSRRRARVVRFPTTKPGDL